MNPKKYLVVTVVLLVSSLMIIGLSYGLLVVNVLRVHHALGEAYHPLLWYLMLACVVAVPVVLTFGIIYPWRYVFCKTEPILQGVLRRYLLIVLANILGAMIGRVYALSSIDILHWASLFLVGLIPLGCVSVAVGLLFMAGYLLWHFSLRYVVVLALIITVWAIPNTPDYVLGLGCLLTAHLLLCVVMFFRKRRCRL